MKLLLQNVGEIDKASPSTVNTFILHIFRHVAEITELGDLVQTELKSTFKFEDDNPISYITSANSETLRGHLCLVALHSQDIQVFMRNEYYR